MRSSLVGVNRGGQTRRKAPIHRWGLSTFGEMYFCVRVRVGWYSACLQLHYPSFQCTGLLVVSSFVFCDVVCTMYARYIVRFIKNVPFGDLPGEISCCEGL